MKKSSLAVAALCFTVAAGSAAAKSGPAKSAQAVAAAPTAQAQSAAPKDTTPPSYDMKPQSLLDLDQMNQKFIMLAQTVPQEKFNWHPSDDTRTFAQLFLHVSGERYGFLALMGAQKPADIDFKTYEKSTTDKAQIIAELNKSWDFTKTTINGMTNADFAKLLPKLGPDANEGDVIYLLVSDAHEHMGQAIAYCRANGITPPWTTAALAAAAAKEKKDKN